MASKEKKTYDRDFLLNLEHVPDSTLKPADFPDLSGIVESTLNPMDKTELVNNTLYANSIPDPDSEVGKRKKRINNRPECSDRNIDEDREKRPNSGKNKKDKMSNHGNDNTVYESKTVVTGDGEYKNKKDKNKCDNDVVDDVKEKMKGKSKRGKTERPRSGKGRQAENQLQMKDRQTDNQLPDSGRRGSGPLTGENVMMKQQETAKDVMFTTGQQNYNRQKKQPAYQQTKGKDGGGTGNVGNTPKGQGHKNQRKNTPKAPKQIFEPYWFLKDVSDGLKRGQLIQGPLRINPKNYEECYIPHPDGVSDIFISGLKDRNRALNGDIVAVLILGREQWRVDMNNVGCYEENVKKSSATGSDIAKEGHVLKSKGQNEEKTEVKDKGKFTNKSPRSIENENDSDPDVVIESEEEIDLVTGQCTKLNENSKKTNGNSAIDLNLTNQQEGASKDSVSGKNDMTGEIVVDVNKIEAGVSDMNLSSCDNMSHKRNVSQTKQNSSSKRNSDKGRNSAKSTPQKKYTSLQDVLQDGSPVVKKLFDNQEKESPTGTNSDKYLQRTGKVVAIIEPKHSRACTGNIRLMSDKNPNKAMFAPTDSRVPRIIIPMKDCPQNFMTRPEDHANTLFIARITDWPETSAMAHGELKRSLGEAGEIEPETEGILIENDVDFSEFSQQALDCLPVKDLPWVIPEKEFSYRRDFRDVCIFTIDPTTARDLDDAVSIEKLKDGTFEVGVHIADVSYFLKEGTVLDRIASLRATSVYLVQKVIPMLPRILCEQLCSLNPNEDRLTFSVVWKMSSSGEIYEEWFGKSVINSCVKLSYDHAQGFIENPNREWQTEELPSIARFSIEDIKKRVLSLNKIALCLRKKRFDGGALRLDQVKIQYSLDQETGLPNGYKIYEQRDSNRLIEEYMLLANMAVAHKINSAYPSLALLRRHPPPQTKMVDELSALCETLGVPIDMSSAGNLQESLWSYCSQDEFSSARMQVLVSMCSKPMQNALYFCTGSIDDEELYRHYALNVPLYTHFTSPIRRYADVVVHRQLAAALGCCEESTKSVSDVQKQAQQCNDKKMNSKRVQDLSSELFFAVFVKAAGPFEEKAMVMGVLDKAFDVFIMKFGVAKRVYCDKLQLKDKLYIKEQKNPVLTLTWAATDKHKDEVSQRITIFTVVDCVIQPGDRPLAWMVTIKHPNDKAIS